MTSNFLNYLIYNTIFLRVKGWCWFRMRVGLDPYHVTLEGLAPINQKVMLEY